MIHIILRGDFGNQLFQYAIGRRLALHHQTDLVFILSNRLSLSDWNGHRLMNKLSVFQLPVSYRLLPPYKARIAHSLKLNRLTHMGEYYREKNWGYDSHVLELPDESYLFGYFQSEKYFKDIASIIRDDLTIHISSKSQSLLEMESKLSQTNSVSIHVRRGDYVKSKRHHVCHLPYYEKAIKSMRKALDDPLFFVFSDDIEWCRLNLHFEDIVFVEASSLGEQPITDFRLMSLCKHHIISNSSFSWWAAWLNNAQEKIVVSPNRWFNDEPLNQQAVRDTIPENWVKIQC